MYMYVTTAIQDIGFLNRLTGFIPKPILSVRVVEKDACCLSSSLRCNSRLTTEGENGKARPFYTGIFLFKRNNRLHMEFVSAIPWPFTLRPSKADNSLR